MLTQNFQSGTDICVNEMGIKNYYLGCPVWSHKEWQGEFFEEKTNAKGFLKAYASVFNSVEGNTTFYAPPNKETVLRWNQETPDDFKFTLKFPKRISHELRLKKYERDLMNFLEPLSFMSQKLGLLFLQLAPSFSKKDERALIHFLEKLPDEFNYAVEFRHLDFYQEGNEELESFLKEKSINWVIFDTESLHVLDAEDESTKRAQGKKPKMPTRVMRTGKHPFLRFVGHNDPERNRVKLDSWAEQVKKWIVEGCTPYVFIHAPDTKFAPRQCRFFHERLAEKLGKERVGAHLIFPAEKQADFNLMDYLEKVESSY